MSNEEGSTELARSTAKMYSTAMIGVEVAVIAAAIVFFAALAPGAAALLLILGTVAFHALTCAIKAHYATNPAGAAAAYGFPTYAALKASWPWAVRMVAC